MDQNKPWDLAKDAANNVALHQVCSVLINAFDALTRYLAPVLPDLARGGRLCGRSMTEVGGGRQRAGHSALQPPDAARDARAALRALFEPPAQAAQARKQLQKP